LWVESSISQKLDHRERPTTHKTDYNLCTIMQELLNRQGMDAIPEVQALFFNIELVRRLNILKDEDLQGHWRLECIALITI